MGRAGRADSSGFMRVRRVMRDCSGDGSTNKSYTVLSSLTETVGTRHRVPSDTTHIQSALLASDVISQREHQHRGRLLPSGVLGVEAQNGFESKF